MENGENRRRRFYPRISLGSILASLAFIGSAFGVYGQMQGDIRKHESEIVMIKNDAQKQENRTKEERKELRDEIREVKQDVKEIRQDVQKVLQEMVRKPR